MKQNVIRMTWLVGVLLIFPWAWAQAEVNDARLGIITDDLYTTAYQIGEDIRALVAPYGIDLAVHHSRGDVENIHAVYQRPGNHLGLVASDVLAFVAKAGTHPRLNLMANKIKQVAPLYHQEVHLLARAPIKAFADLAGRRVAVGDVQSGTHLTCRLLLEVTGVRPAALLAIGGGQALAALRDGRIDALLTVDGAPVKWLSTWVSAVDALALVPITDQRIRQFYPKARIPAGTYPWQADAVDTVAVKTVLVAYDFRNQYCNAIGKVAWLIKTNLPWLKQNGHTKWETVRLDDPVKGWEPYACVLDYMPHPHDNQPIHRLPEPVANPVVDALEAVFQP